ncbi:MAG: hypothetical protein ABR564_07675 [Candidatus Dormibacteria bacterium]
MADSPIRHFLLVFDRKRAELAELQEFGEDGGTALAAYEAKEKELGNAGAVSHMEIVLIGSDSLETVKLTHANYFDGTAAASRFLVGI